MAAPTISAITTVPNRENATNQASFSNDVDTFFSEVGDFQTEANEQASYLDDLAVQVDASEAAAAASALEASGYASTAIDARDAAIASSVYKGTWEGKTSAGVIGESYSYQGSYIYRLNINLANISTSVPSPTNTNWQLINVVPFDAPCKPTLDLDFANQDFTIYDKLGGFVKRPLADIVSQGRSTAGTSTDAIGGVTEFAAGENRFTFDGETGEALGYLSEESRTNLIVGSEVYPYTFATVGNMPFSQDLYLSPDGTLTADSITGAFVTSSARLEKTYSFTIGTICTISWFEKSIDGTYDDTMIPFSGVGITFVKNPRVLIANGWYRYSYTFTCTSSSQIIRMYYSRWNASLNLGETYAFWGFQLEVGNFPTSYIRTLGTAVTRSVDSMTRTLGQEWNPNEGTFVVDALVGGGVFPTIFSASRNSLTSNEITIYRGAVTSSGIEPFTLAVRINSVNVAVITLSGDSKKIAVSYDANGVYVANDVGQFFEGLGFDASGVKANTLHVLTSAVRGWNANGTIKRLQYYPRAFDSLTLQRLSRIQ